MKKRMRAFLRGELVTVMVIALVTPSLPTCHACCLTVGGPAETVAMQDCCMAGMTMSCPVADLGRPWLQQSRAPFPAAVNTPLTFQAVPVQLALDARPSETVFHLPAFNRQVSPPLLV